MARTTRWDNMTAQSVQLVELWADLCHHAFVLVKKACDVRLGR